MNGHGGPNGHGGHPQVQQPIDQAAYVGNRPAALTPIVPIHGVPQPSFTTTVVEPAFLQHLSRHQGQRIAIMTSAGRIQGELAGVGADHVQINVEDRSLHIRIPHIIYFEGPLASYR
jgi:hypothetical protein